MTLKSKYKKQLPLFFVGLFILAIFFTLVLFFPYNGDDWAWGSSIGIDRLTNGFKDYNGRYAGNLLVIAVTHVKALKLIILPICYFLICFLTYKFANNKNSLILLFSFFLLLIVPKDIFRQTIVWTAGFANYVPSTLISLYFIFIFRDVFSSNCKDYPNFQVYLSFVLSVIGALFMENITIFNVIFAVIIIIWTKIKHKKPPHNTLCEGFCFY